MALALESDDGPIAFDDALAEAVVRNSVLKAELVAGYLSALGAVCGKTSWPAGFLRELGAVVQLKLWEIEGVAEFLDEGLPTFAEAVADLTERIERDPHLFDDPSGSTLSRKVFLVWLKCFAWEAQPIFQTDVVVGEVDEDTLLDAVAQLLWAHRHNKSDYVHGSKEVSL